MHANARYLNNFLRAHSGTCTVLKNFVRISFLVKAHQKLDKFPIENPLKMIGLEVLITFQLERLSVLVVITDIAHSKKNIRSSAMQAIYLAFDSINFIQLWNISSKQRSTDKS